VRTCVRGLKSCREPRRDRKLLFRRTLLTRVFELSSHTESFVSQYSICKERPCGKGLATHRRVDGIEDDQSVDIRNASNSDRIARDAVWFGETIPSRYRGSSKPK
jgi:hypothetical protein